MKTSILGKSINWVSAEFTNMNNHRKFNRRTMSMSMSCLINELGQIARRLARALLCEWWESAEVYRPAAQAAGFLKASKARMSRDGRLVAHGGASMKFL